MTSVVPIAWDAPGPYRVAFATRAGGTSDGPYASLNLGLLTADDEARVLENRRRLCAAVGADAARATMSHQQHGTTVTRARPTGIVARGLPTSAATAAGRTSRARRWCS
ncbi:MAG: laccase domain-containing protein [Thermoleophilia bacterium]